MYRASYILSYTHLIDAQYSVHTNSKNLACVLVRAHLHLAFFTHFNSSYNNIKFLYNCCRLFFWPQYQAVNLDPCSFLFRQASQIKIHSSELRQCQAIGKLKFTSKRILTQSNARFSPVSCIGVILLLLFNTVFIIVFLLFSLAVNSASLNPTTYPLHYESASQQIHVHCQYPHII